MSETIANGHDITRMIEEAPRVPGVDGVTSMIAATGVYTVKLALKQAPRNYAHALKRVNEVDNRLVTAEGDAHLATDVADGSLELAGMMHGDVPDKELYQLGLGAWVLSKDHGERTTVDAAAFEVAYGFDEDDGTKPYNGKRIMDRGTRADMAAQRELDSAKIAKRSAAQDLQTASKRVADAQETKKAINNLAKRSIAALALGGALILSAMGVGIAELPSGENQTAAESSQQGPATTGEVTFRQKQITAAEIGINLLGMGSLGGTVVGLIFKSDLARSRARRVVKRAQAQINEDYLENLE